jgi:hypothetical protein
MAYVAIVEEDENMEADYRKAVYKEILKDENIDVLEV